MDTLPFRHRPLATLVALLPFTLQAPGALAAQVFRWDGDGPSNAWSYVQNDPTRPGFGTTNWNTLVAVPNGLVTLEFGGVRGLTSVNDIDGLVVSGLTFLDGAGAFTLQGKGIHSAAFIANKSASLQSIALPITLDANQTWDGGPGGMKVGGDTVLNGHALTLSRNVALDRGAGSLVIGAGTNDSIEADGGSTVIAADARLGTTTTGRGRLSLRGSGSGIDVSGILGIGEAGTGEMFLSDHATAHAGTTVIGNLAGSAGRAQASGDGVAWATDGDLLVGAHGSGSLLIDGQARLTATDAHIARYSDGQGAVTVSHFGTMAVANALLVGENGDGKLVIDSGGRVDDTVGLIGTNTGSTGRVEMRGQSAWTSTDTLYVGASGAGTLLVDGGSRVENRFGSVGSRAGSTGLVTVQGQSEWSTTDTLAVGGAGAGTLLIDGASSVDDKSAYIGRNAGSTGRVELRGHATWTTADTLEVGSFGDGSLLVSDGSKVNAKFGYIGNWTGSHGSTVVDGLDSSLVVTNWFVVGGFFHLTPTSTAEGTLSILNGGLVQSPRADIGWVAGSVGRVLVSGAQSRWETGNDFNVGSNGNGSLEIRNGGVVTSGISNIARFDDSVGSVLVDGKGSLWSADSIGVGTRGSGRAEVRAGGHVEANHTDIHDGDVTVSGKGSLWTSDRTLSVIGGKLDILDGARVENASTVTLEANAHVTIDGPGSAWQEDGYLYLGDVSDADTSSITIRNGGALFEHGNWTFIGDRLGSTGIVSVDGAGSQWGMTTGAYIGNAATGIVTVTAGGRVNAPIAWLGYRTGGNGTLEVRDAGSQWRSAIELNVGGGAGGHGTLRVAQGGTVIDTYGTVGHWSHGLGNAVIEGANSAWINTKELDIGGEGTGSVVVANGGRVTAPVLNVGASGALELIGGTAEVDEASILAGGKVTLGEGVAFGGTTGLTIAPDGLLAYRGNATLTGRVTNDGHIARADSLVNVPGPVGDGSTGPATTGTSPTAPRLTLTGEVDGNGDFSGDIHMQGLYRPGHGIAAIDFHGGDLTIESGARLALEINGGGNGGFDRLFNIHRLDFEGGLELDFGADFAAPSGATLALFDFQSFAGSFAPDRVTVLGLDAARVNLSTLGVDGLLRIGAMPVLQPGGVTAPVPLPPALWLLGSSLVGLGSISRGQAARRARQ